MANVRIYVKRQIAVNRLNFDQKTMLALGNVALSSRKESVTKGQTVEGSAAAPLRKRYAKRKAKLGLKPIRDLVFSGELMRGWLVRTVSDNRAHASWSTRRNRKVAAENDRREKFIGFSKTDERSVTVAGQRLLTQMIPRLALTRSLGIKN